jgi:ABC-type transporter Mla subunit MlaD
MTATREMKINLTVGVFVIMGLVALGIMIVMFGEAPKTFTPTYRVTIDFPKTGPVRAGDPVYMNGLEIGVISQIRPQGDVRRGVQVICRIEDKYAIPVDAQPLIRGQTLALGKPSIVIEVGPDNAEEILPTDDTAELHGVVADGIAELIPKETMRDLEAAGKSLTALSDKLQPVAEDLHYLLQRTPVDEFDAASTQPTTTADGSTLPTTRPLANLSTAVQRFDSALKHFNDIMGDPQNKDNLAVMLENFRKVSERGLTLSDELVKTSDKLNTLIDHTDSRIDGLSRSLMNNSDQLSVLLTELNKTARSLNSTEGTAGKFVNDPRLYDSLVLTTDRLESTLKDLRELIIDIRDKGLKTNLFGK